MLYDYTVQKNPKNGAKAFSHLRSIHQHCTGSASQKYKFLRITLSTTLLTLLPIVAASESLTQKMKLDAIEAFTTWKHLITDTETACIRFEFQTSETFSQKTLVGLQLRELHNTECGGDVNTSPVIGYVKLEFSPLNTLRNFYIFDPTSGTYFMVDALK